MKKKDIMGLWGVFAYNIITDLFINTDFDITSLETSMTAVFKFLVIL